MAEAKPDTEEGSEEDQNDDQDGKDTAMVGEEPPQKTSTKFFKRDPFLTETKYVVLNFMSLVPRDLFHNHLSSSPESAISDLSVGDSYNKQFHPLGSQYKGQHQLTKSRSFDIPPQRIPKLKHLSHLSALQDAESPASEDNLNYRYRQYLHELGQQSIHDNSPCSPEIGNTPETCEHDPSDIKSRSIPSLKSESPGSLSPRKTPHSLSRWYSDISSSGDFSYASDADDEEEDLSNASSTFSMRSACLRGGFLDLRKPSPRLEAEFDEVDGIFHSVDGAFHPMPPVAEEQTKQNDDDDDVKNGTQNTDIASETTVDTSNTKTPSPRQGSPFIKQHSKNSSRSHAHDSHLWSHVHHHLHPIAGSSQDTEDVDSGECSDRRVADRFKLKLDIPTQIVQLDDILVSLQTDLNSEITDMESEFEEALRSSSNVSGRRHTSVPTPLTPQTEAARILARIGDEVRDQYGSQITAAVNEVMLHKLKELTYKQFKEIAKAVIDENLPGWRQVALLMVFGQKMVWKALETGQKQFGSLVDLSAQLVADVAADFIIREGGWGAVMNFDPSQSSDSQSSAIEDKSPSVLDYFSSHNVTQVESGDLKDETAEIDSSSSGTNVDTGQKSKGKVMNNVDGSGEPFKQDTGNGNEFNNENCGIVTEEESMDGVFSENTNQNAQHEDHIADPYRLSASGRELAPSLGFEYRNETQSERSDISSAGFQFSQTEYVQDVFDYDLNQTTQKMKIEKENEENRKQNQGQPNHSSEVNTDSNNARTIEATTDVKQDRENNGIESVQEIMSNHVVRDETSDFSVNPASTADGNNSGNDDIDNHNTQDNKTIPDKTIEDIATTSDNTANETDNSTSQNEIDADNSASQNENKSGEDNQWYSAYRRLGYGAVGMSLGVLALGLAIRQMR